MQVFDRLDEGHGLVFQTRRLLQAEKSRDAQRGRGTEPRRMHEGQQFQDIEGGEGFAAQMGRCRLGMAHDRHGLERVRRRVPAGQRFDFAIGGEPHGAGVVGDQNRRERQFQRRRGGFIGHGAATIPAQPGRRIAKNPRMRGHVFRPPARVDG